MKGNRAAKIILKKWDKMGNLNEQILSIIKPQ